ncbi:MAG: M12 family metallo-peptidase [Phycisphaerales bacterium]
MAQSREFRRALRAAFVAFVTTVLCNAPAAAQIVPMLQPFERSFDPAIFLTEGQSFTVDLEQLRAVPANGETLIAAFPLTREESVDLVMHRIDPLKADTRLVAVDRFGREIPVARSETHFLGGSVVGLADSSAFIAVTDAGVFGWVQTSEAKFIISSGPTTDAHAPAVFDTASASFGAIAWVPFSCGALQAPGVPQNEFAVDGVQSMLATCRTVDVALDTDQEYLAAFGGNQAAALGYLQTLVAGSDEIYRRDLSVQLRLSYARLWTTADPWTGTDSLVQLEQFRTYWLAQMGSVGRDVAHLISPRNLGGGIAWGDALCSSFSYGVCGNMSGFFPTPMVNNSVQNYDIATFPHELGHNCGAIHTHEYCPPVDQCAPAGYFGACQTAQVCISNGTMMSYCNLCTGGESNIVLAFHPASAAEIAGFMATTGCAPVVNCSSNPACVLSISSASATIPPLGGSASITVSTIAPGCAWTPVTVPSWITVTNPGPASGSGTFAYTVSANATISDRTATLQIGDLTHTVTQLSSFDCDGNGLADASEITANPALDCNSDGVLNSCEITEGAADCDGNGVPDSCQVTTTVRAWGAGSPGTTGGSNYGQSTIPANLGTTKFIAAGAYHSLAVRLDGTVIGWGLNTSGQVTIPASLPKVKAVAGGGNHSAALVLDGSIVCWGLNTDGQCNVPSALGAAKAVAAGTSHTVALRSAGTVACWGANTSGQSTVPAGLSGITSISAGALNTLALGSTGTITGWGQNVYGQSTPPTGLAGVTMIASGAAHSVALRGDGTMACWGNNSFAQCTVPTDIGVVQKVFAGGYVTIALRVDGSVRMWGRNESGQSTLPAGLANDRMLAAGTAHTLTLEAASTLADCDQDGTPDGCELQGGSADCDRNGVPDSCDIAAGAADANGNGVPDSCEPQTGEPTQWRVADGGNGHWYVVRRNSSPICWDAASALATAMGGYLATITSSQEHERITSLTAALQGPTAELGPWIGATCSGRPWGEWYWVTGEPFTYQGWLPSAPNPGWNEEYVHLWRWLDGRWNDGYRCGTDAPTTVHGYVIEWSADCNNDGIVDYGQILAGQLPDTDGNGVPDGCDSSTPSCPGANPAVVNDCAQDAIEVVADATLNFTNIGCNTDGPTHPAATCGSGNDVFLNDIWYRVQATANGPMRISTCNQVNFDTKLAVYDMGTDPLSFNYGALASAFVACNDDGDAACQANAVYASDLSLTVNAGRWYLIRVAAYDFPGSGSVSINLPEPCALPPFTGVEAEACGANTNGGCNGAGTQAITAGSRIKGTLWESAGSRDVDYYSITVTGELEVTARVYAASLVTCQILGGDIGVPNCGGLSVLKNGSGNCPSEATTCLRTGTYYIAVSTSTGGGYPCGSGLLNEYVLEVVTAPAYCPVETNGACNAPGPNTATINSANTALNGLVRCATQPAFPACRSGGSSANSYARSFPVGAVAGTISCINFGVWSVIRDTNAAGNDCGLFLSDRPLPATVGVYRDLDGGDPRNKIVAAGDGNDLELIEARQVLIPGVAAVQTLNFEPPICVDSAASNNLVIILDFPNLRDGSTGIPADAGYQLLAGGNTADAGSATFIRLDCADSALRYVIAETLGATFTARWYVAVNGDWSACDTTGDCNGDGVSDITQCREGSLPDYNSNDIPDCCEQGTTCVVGNYPVQWRVEDGGNGHWYGFTRVADVLCWNTARFSAQSAGGHLATVTSGGENQFVVALAASQNPGVAEGGPFLGGTCQGVPWGQWTWVTGEPFSFTAWGPSEPNSGGGERYIHLWRWSQLTWNDTVECSSKSYIIEWSADCNADGIVDYGQILLGQLADTDGNGVPDSCERPADIDGDGSVNGGDLALLLGNWGGTGTGDIDRDGTVTGGDLALLLGDWG